jgi:hypothetical protein
MMVGWIHESIDGWLDDCWMDLREDVCLNGSMDGWMD